MGGITKDNVEWAVVNRLKAMLDDPPVTKFNVTQSFALFTAIVLWSKQRAWVAGNNETGQRLTSEQDVKAHGAREALRKTRITEEPWDLSRKSPMVASGADASQLSIASKGINSDFKAMTAEDFFKWLRDALAHGDGRTIRPIHKISRAKDQALLAGFEIRFREHRTSKSELTLDLYHKDMRHIGALLADLFCKSLAASQTYFEEDVATRIDEVAA